MPGIITGREECLGVKNILAFEVLSDCFGNQCEVFIFTVVLSFP